MMCESSSEARVKMHVKWWRSYIYDPGFLTGSLHQHHHKINVDYMITHSFTGVWQGLRNSLGVQSSTPECQMVKNTNTNILFLSAHQPNLPPSCFHSLYKPQSFYRLLNLSYIASCCVQFGQQTIARFLSEALCSMFHLLFFCECAYLLRSF